MHYSASRLDKGVPFWTVPASHSGAWKNRAVCVASTVSASEPTFHLAWIADIFSMNLTGVS